MRRFVLLTLAPLLLAAAPPSVNARLKAISAPVSVLVLMRSIFRLGMKVAEKL